MPTLRRLLGPGLAVLLTTAAFTAAAATKADYESLAKHAAQFGEYSKELGELAEQVTNPPPDHELALYLSQEAKVFFIEALLLSDHLLMYMLTDAGETRTQIRKIVGGRLRDVDSQIESALKVTNDYVFKTKNPALAKPARGLAKALKEYRETVKRIAKELGTKDAKW